MFGDGKYYKDYVVEVVEKNGKPKKRSIYVGELCAYARPVVGARQKALILLGGGLILLSIIGAGICCLSNSVYYVTVPFVLQILAYIIFAFAATELSLYGSRIKANDKKRTADRISPATIALAALAGATILGELGFLLFDNAKYELWRELAFIICNAFTAVASVITLFVSKGLEFTEIENPDAARIQKQREDQIQVDAMLAEEKKQAEKSASREANKQFRARRNKN